MHYQLCLTVLNLCYLNQYLLKDKFKHEDLKIFIQVVDPGDYMCMQLRI